MLTRRADGRAGGQARLATGKQADKRDGRTGKTDGQARGRAGEQAEGKTENAFIHRKRVKFKLAIIFHDFRPRPRSGIALL